MRHRTCRLVADAGGSEPNAGGTSAGRFVVAYDVGTSGVKTVITDHGARVMASRYVPYDLVTGPRGEVAQDLDEIMAAIGSATRNSVSACGLAGKDILGIGVTGQMFNLVAADARGEPLLPIIHWLDLRAGVQAYALKTMISEPEQFRILGSVVTAKDLIPKIMWLRDERPEIWRRTVWFLDCKDAVIARLTGVAATDHGTGAAFRLLDPGTRTWSATACSMLGIPLERLPPMGPAPRVAGWLRPDAAGILGLPKGTPVVVGGGDVLATQVGSGAVDVGDAQLSIGTAAYWGITMAEPGRDPNQRVGMLAHMDPESWILWLEIATAGGAMAWLTRILFGDGPADHAAVDGLVRDSVGEDVPIFAPWLTGERAPLFDDDVRGAFVGLDIRHGRGHLLRAVMEGVALQIRWAFDYAASFGRPIGSIRAIGGATLSHTWLQIIADALERPLLILDNGHEAGALGAAENVLVALGVEPDFRFAAHTARIVRTVWPDQDGIDRLAVRYGRYRALYAAIRPLPAEG